MPGKDNLIEHPADYVNPVYPRSFPDPFVFKHKGEYFGYSTDFASDGNVFSIIHSHDLVNWEYLGGAMPPLETAPPFYWAPEVSYSNGLFYLYYSTGNETLMEIRVAVSDRPDGGFVDSGYCLTKEEFAIDPHVFTDDDGTAYMFYATDFLDHSHVGTGTVVDKMIDAYNLEGDPRVVTRAKYDWQVYDPNRKEKGGVRWHTVEGPAVIKRKNIYYEMFSGGNWKNTTYGVSFASSASIRSRDEWAQYSDGEKILPILRTIPESVIGPGHNSIVRGPNNRELYCVYHRWTEHGRVMAIDRMDFAGRRIYVAGATTTPQPAPYSPGLRGFATGGRFGWEAKGGWQFDGTEAIGAPEGRSELTCSMSGDSFLCEFYIRCSQACDNDPIAGLSINSDFNLLFDPKNSRMTIIQPRERREIAFPTGFSLDRDQHIRLEVNGLTVSVVIGNSDLRCDATLAGAARYLTLFTENSRAVFSAFELTEGFEELFQKNGLLCEEDGWQLIGSAKGFQVSGGELTISTGAGEPAIASRAARSGNVEAAANIRLVRPLSADAEFALVLLDSANEVKMKLGIATVEERFVALASVGHERRVFSSVVDTAEYHQFRIETTTSFARVYLDGDHLGDVPTPAGVERIGVLCAQADIAVEMLRFTAI